MPEVIETEGTVTEETNAPAPATPPKEKLYPDDIATEDVPIYTVAAAIEWLQRPENAEDVRRWSDSVKASWKGFISAIDRDVSKTGRLVVDMCRDENVMNDVKSHFLKSLIGGD